MSGLDYFPELASGLERLLPLEQAAAGDWSDVLRRARAGSQTVPAGRVRRFVRGGSRLRLVLVVSLVFLVLAGIATATYLALRSSAPPAPSSGARLTIVGQDPAGEGWISVVEPDGHLRVLWRCHTTRRQGICGEVNSVAWSPGGKRVAFTLDDSIAGTSLEFGLHIIDLATGKDLHIPTVAPSLPLERLVRRETLERLVRQTIRRLGCPLPGDLAWSPDGRRLAYSCTTGPGGPDTRSQIFVINADGSGRTLVPTGVRAAYWPSWSPDGSRIAFATGRVPYARTPEYQVPGPYTYLRSSIYSVRLDGSQRRLLATNASAPDWSPDGKLIAYQSLCGGIKLITPSGQDRTPTSPGRGGCATIGLPGRPAWSPDGSKIAISVGSAISAGDGVWLMNANGSALKQLTAQTGTALFDTGRPAWAPQSAPTRNLQHQPTQHRCRRSCL